MINCYIRNYMFIYTDTYYLFMQTPLDLIYFYPFPFYFHFYFVNDFQEYNGKINIDVVWAQVRISSCCLTSPSINAVYDLFQATK